MKRQVEEDQIKELKRRYGTHGQVANELGVTPRHYLRIRRGKHVTPTVLMLIERILEKK